MGDHRLRRLLVCSLIRTDFKKAEKGHTMMKRGAAGWTGLSGERLPDEPTARTENQPDSWSAASAPAATAADKLGLLIASQKLLATLGISGPVGAHTPSSHTPSHCC